ncbi:Outer membrane porin F precursor [Marinomonas aquimarina]|uniref:Outer membrane porin F n=1 Tax=Marinomonas aquimarina TaxID=295068 RepID=A0A1A8TJ75_9GAMM|nr:OmpA family protein [Marinomonas aquimarina]SBS33485.1 Outer membrane porin F precursor [Marinomonas aquimarina]
MTLKTITQNCLVILSVAVTPFGFASEPLYDAQQLPPNIADEDKDGVVNIRDFCDGTAFGLKVDNDGCPDKTVLRQSMNLEVLFDTDKYIIKSYYNSEIQELVDFMNEHPDSTVVIEGHTDSVGSDEYNEVLSRNRANAVVAMLIDEYGIDQERVSGVGYGESRPIASNESAMGRQQNRRVMAEIYGEQTTQIKRWNIYSVDNMDLEPALAPNASSYSNGF